MLQKVPISNVQLKIVDRRASRRSKLPGKRAKKAKKACPKSCCLQCNQYPFNLLLCELDTVFDQVSSQMEGAVSQLKEAAWSVSGTNSLSCGGKPFGARTHALRLLLACHLC